MSENSKYCECGCGELISIKDSRGRFRRFVNHHSFKRENNPNWKGGYFFDKDNYILIRKPEHPQSNINGYIYCHRLIYEHYLSIIFDEEIFIPQEYEIHHINKQTNDNSLINLQLMLSKQEHRKEHIVSFDGRLCCICGTNRSSIRNDSNNREKWHGSEKKGWKCVSCHKKEYYIKNKERISEYKKRYMKNKKK